MDVYCSTCNEPWDTYHLWQDAIFDVLPHDEAKAWCSLPREKKLTPKYREQFRAAGWVFGESIINVIRCPGCVENAKANREKLETKAAIEKLLGDDEDGLAAAFEEFGL